MDFLSLISLGIWFASGFRSAISKVSTGSCSFPEFVWRLNQDSKERIWFTQAKYGQRLESRRKILAKEGILAVHIQYMYYWMCEDEEEKENEGDSCVSTKFMATIGCSRSEGNNTYRVVRTSSQGISTFMCMRFIKRNQNIIQIWISESSETNQGDLCAEGSLRREQWPWIAEKQTEWSPCPPVGGYDFQAFLNGKTKPECHRVWRPSRLESECILGEGIHFFLPEKSCSFFNDKILENHLHCWGWWRELGYTYVVAGESGKQPQFVIRYPEIMEGPKMRAHMLFSPVCPDNEEGDPQGKVVHVTLELQQSESGMSTCYDESRKCSEILDDGMCINGNLYHYGNYCKRSCGLCELLDTDKAECDFPLTYKGEWLLFERDRKEHVTISSGKIRFSQLGEFVCKAKHWSKNIYKFLSVYDNGCRPRYTCMEFIANQENNYLEFRMSQSNEIDQSIDFCRFAADDPPVNDRIRSYTMKLLFPISRATRDGCGLGGLVELRASLGDSRSCHGSLSDWNPYTCSFTSKLSLSLSQCNDRETEPPREYTCEAYIRLPQNLRLLYTRVDGVDNKDTSYQCWLISMSGNKGSSRSAVYWKQASILDRSHCGLEGGLYSVIYQPAQITLQIRKEPDERRCVNMNGSTPYYSTFYIGNSHSESRASRTDNKPRLEFITQPNTATALYSFTYIYIQTGLYFHTLLH